MVLAVVTPGTSDAAALAELKASTFRETYAAANSSEEVDRHVARAFAVDVVTRELVDPRSLQRWVADDGWPVGYLKLNVGTAQTETGLDGGIEIEQLYARRSHQGRGVGRMLLDDATELARGRAIPFVWLGVWEHNTNGIAFYERHGFEVFGEHEFVFGDESQRDLLMRLSLRLPRTAT